MDEQEPWPLLTILVDGKVVAEAPLHVYDGGAAWTAFQDVFPQLAPLLVGEFFDSMRYACNPALVKAPNAPRGMRVELHTQAKPQLYVPNGSGLPPPPGGY